MNKALEESSNKKTDFPTRAYLRFCKIYGLNPIISDKKDIYLQIERFTVWRLKVLQGTGGTALSDIGSIQHWFALKGIHSDIRNEHKPMQKILKGAMKCHPPKTQAARPLYLWELKAIFNKLPINNIDSVVIRAAWALALTTALRGEEFLAHTTKNDNSERKMHYVRKGRLFLWEPDPTSKKKHFGVVWFWKSKTNHVYNKEFATMVCGCQHGICAITELQRLLKFMNNPKEQTALFTWKNGSYFTASQSREYLKKFVNEIGSSHINIGNNSLKKACIIFAMKNKTPDTIAVQLARWKSFQSIRSYINLNPRQLVEAREMYDDNNRQIEVNRFRQYTWNGK